MAGPLPVAFNESERDRALQAIRARVDAAIGRGESVVVLGDFNVAPDEPGYRDLVAGLHDAHAEVGQGPGWTWRPSRFEGTGIGLLRIDLALSGPNLPPVAAREHCGFPGDHCQFEAWFSLAGASLGQQSFQLLLPGHDPIKALPVSILDTTGLVIDANAAIEPFANPDGAHPVPGSPERMRINWLGGACDRDVRARVTRSGSDLLVTIDTFVPGDGGCTLEGISRTFELRVRARIRPRPDSALSRAESVGRREQCQLQPARHVEADVAVLPGRHDGAIAEYVAPEPATRSATASESSTRRAAGRDRRPVGPTSTPST